jgi:hypothetical protein
VVQLHCSPPHLVLAGFCATSAKVMLKSETSRSCHTNVAGDLWPSCLLEEVIDPRP